MSLTRSSESLFDIARELQARNGGERRWVLYVSVALNVALGLLVLIHWQSGSAAVGSSKPTGIEARVSQLETAVESVFEILKVHNAEVFRRGRGEETVRGEAQGGSDYRNLVVTAKKANLRNAPDLEASVVLAVDEGTRLLSDSREGEWYRVLAPSGEWVWVAESVVRTIETPAIS